MNAKEFDKLREGVIKRCKELTTKKGKDYTQGNIDVLKNFKGGGETFGVDDYKILGVYLKKQIDAIYSFIKNGGQVESEPIGERIVDAINYLIFLKALHEDLEEKNGLDYSEINDLVDDN